MEPVLNLSPKAISAMCSLSKRAMRAFFDAIEKVEASRGTQILVINDREAAKEIVQKGLVKPAKYAGRVTPGRFVMPRDVAFCSEEPTIAELQNS